MTGRQHFRSAARPHVACNVRLRLGQGRDSTEILCYTRDIGQGGLFAVTEAALVNGASVDLVIEAPSLWQAVVLPAEVAWSQVGDGHEPGGVGLKFKGLNERDRLALDELLCALDFEA